MERKKFDISTNIDVTREELRTGTEREVSLKTGEIINVTIPPKTVNGDVLTLKGLGKKNPDTNRRGNLNLIINLIDEERTTRTVKKRPNSNVSRSRNGASRENERPVRRASNDYEEVGEKKKRSREDYYDNQRSSERRYERDYEERNQYIQTSKREKVEYRENSYRPNFYNPNVINYDAVVFINSYEAESGCLKKVKIPPRKKVMIPIKRNVENEEIIEVNIEGMQKRVLVIVDDTLPLKVMDTRNTELSQASDAVKNSEYRGDFVVKNIMRDGQSISYRIPRFRTRKVLMYIRGNNNKPGYKVVITKEDFSYYLGLIIYIGTVFLIGYFVGPKLFNDSDGSDFFFCIGEVIGYCLLCYLLQFCVGNKRWN